MQLFTHLLSSYLQGIGDFFSALYGAVKVRHERTASGHIKTTILAKPRGVKVITDR